MLLPSPKEVRATFTKLMAENSEAAITYLHEMGLSSGYIKAEEIGRNIHWTTPSAYGELECTINLSKPEKDPQAIAAEALRERAVKIVDENSEVALPKCDLCWENEEFPGTSDHPAKPGLRIAAISLDAERWGLQYSPYAYFSEHCIVLSEQHRPMKIDDACFERLLDFVEQFPFYFIGANADLPIVGGSILSHDHFQGGRHVFPLMKAPIEREIPLDDFPEVQCGIVHWPASVLRLSSENRASITQVASKILRVWRSFSNEACNIIAASDAQHNTLNPIVRKEGLNYTMDLILRNNRTDAQHPWGIFHAPESTHHVKKENIGLIEIMGLAILPPRLAKELPFVQKELFEAVRRNMPVEELAIHLEKHPPTARHAAWAIDVYFRHKAEIRDIDAFDAKQASPSASAQNGELHPIIKAEVARVFNTILESTGVFKHDATGIAGWDSFVEELNLKQ